MTVAADGAFDLKCVAEPDATTAAAPMAVSLFGCQAQLAGKRRDAKVSEPTGRSRRVQSRIRKRKSVRCRIAAGQVIAVFGQENLLTNAYQAVEKLLR